MQAPLRTRGLTLMSTDECCPGSTDTLLHSDAACSHHGVQASNGSLNITLSGSHALQNAAQPVPLQLSRPQLLLEALRFCGSRGLGSLQLLLQHSTLCCLGCHLQRI